MMENTLSLSGVRVNRGSFTLGPLSLSFRGGKVYAFVGENGAGKSTLLSSIYGDLPCEGGIDWNGRSIAALPPFERPFTFVRQDVPLLEMYSVRETLLLSHAFALAKDSAVPFSGLIKKMRSVSAADQARAERIADVIGLRRLLDDRPSVMSGGQRQRVAIAASLAMKGKPGILLDEPTSALGFAETERLIEALTMRMEECDNPIIILASHDNELVERLQAATIVFRRDESGVDSTGPGAYSVRVATELRTANRQQTPLQ